MKTKTKIGLTLGLLSLLALGGLTQSKYVRNATIEMDVTSETDPGVFLANTTATGNSGAPWTTYTIPKTGYYALQLRGGDGGTNMSAIGGKGGVVEAVYYFVKDQQIRYTLGGPGGHYESGSQNQTGGGSSHAGGGKGGNGYGDDSSSKQGSGGGGSSAVELLVNGTTLLVADGGGGGAGHGYDSYIGGVGASNVVGVSDLSNYPNATGRLLAVSIAGRRTDASADKNGQSGSLTINEWGGGGSGGGFTASHAGGQSGGKIFGIKNRPAGAGTGGHSYVNPTGFVPLTNALKTIYAAKLPTSGPNAGDFMPYSNGTNTGGGAIKAGQFRIAYLWSDTTADHTAIDNIYK